MGVTRTKKKTAAEILKRRCPHCNPPKHTEAQLVEELKLHMTRIQEEAIARVASATRSNVATNRIIEIFRHAQRGDD